MIDNKIIAERLYMTEKGYEIREKEMEKIELLCSILDTKYEDSNISIIKENMFSLNFLLINGIYNYESKKLDIGKFNDVKKSIKTIIGIKEKIGLRLSSDQSDYKVMIDREKINYENINNGMS